MAVSQLIYGPLSDRCGRRRPLLVGLAGFALGGLLAASAESFEVLVIARVMQGLGAASIASIIRAIINTHMADWKQPELLPQLVGSW